MLLITSNTKYKSRATDIDAFDVVASKFYDLDY